jgi:glucokinase
VSELLLGIDVGGTKVLGVAIDPDHPTSPLLVRRGSTPGDAGALVEILFDTVVQLRRDCAEAGYESGSIGVGVPGIVDREGVLRGAPNLLCAIDQPVRQRLEQRLGTDVAFANDANCALLAESRVGVGVGASDVVFVALGTGIGGAVMVDGELQVGAHGFAGEPGHMVVVRDGVLCPCGRRGCWERYASGAGLAWLAGELVMAGGAARILELAGGDPSTILGEHVTTAADEGDGDALEVFEQFSRWVALGIGNLMNTLDPDLVIIGGGVSEHSRHFFPRVQELLAGEVLGAGRHRATDVALAHLGPEAGAIGAALLAAADTLPH